MTVQIDLKGWFTVRAVGDGVYRYTVHEVLGTFQHERPHLLIRDPETGAVAACAGISHLEFFAPDDRARAEAYAAKITAESNSEGEDGAEAA